MPARGPRAPNKASASVTNLSTHQSQTLSAKSEKAKGMLLLHSSITENDCSRTQWVPDRDGSVESRCGRCHAPYFRGVLVEVPKVTELFLAAGWGLGARGQTFKLMEAGRRGVVQIRAGWERKGGQRGGKGAGALREGEWGSESDS